jgi:4'-phosphopantetheinyl transferase
MSGARTIESNEVHAYRVCVSACDYDACLRELTHQERARCEQYQQPADRQRYACGRSALRRILGGYLNVPAGAVRIWYSRWRKPHVDGRETVSFNLSHSGDWVLIAVGAHRVGADVEMLRPMNNRAAMEARVFGPTERAQLEQASGEARLESFFRAWVRKEAYLKMHGFGIVDGLSSIDVRADGERGAMIVQSLSRPDREELSLFDVPMPHGYFAAVVAEQIGVAFHLESLDPSGA